ncbi:MAG TPA: hypothetical protein VG267_17920 [Terracidiphilus sp.]|jgi:hypothetical protein|nr:hypothetical protein [Terracidiphilus sp.]
MSEPENSNRDAVYLAEGFRAELVGNENTPNELAPSSDPLPSNGRELRNRVIGSPLPMGGSAVPSSDSTLHRGAIPPGRALSTTGGPAEASSAQRAMGLLKQAVPFVQKLLPLIDGNFGAALANLFSPRPWGAAPHVDLSPVQKQISELQTQHNELHSTVQEQTKGIKRVEDQLELVREATERNTLEQQELIEDLKAMGKKVNLFAVSLSLLLLLSLVLNVILYVHIKRVWP